MGKENGKVKFKETGVVGLVDANKVEVVSQGTYYASNYEVNSKGMLYHYISNNVNATGNQGNYNYVGVAPGYLQRGVEYYSYDGHYFYTDYNVMINDYKNNVRSNSVNANNPYYNYFQYLPLRSKTNYSGAQLTSYLNNKANSSTSKLNNTGDLFVKYQEKNGVNALLAASVAALESGWGKSSIAINKNNLFGLNAVDSNPGEAADTFASVEACISDFTENWMSERYLNAEHTSRYRGGYFGDKGSGIFGQYSSDVYEGEKCASIAANMDGGITSADLNYYTIGIKGASSTTYTSIAVKKEANDSSATLYTTVKNPAYAFIVRKKALNNGYYEVQSDSSLTSDRNDVSGNGEYNFSNNYGYVKSNSLTIVNSGNDVTYPSNSINQAPVITDAKITNVSKNGYTVTCKVTDDGSLDRVQMPTWSENRDQDDLIWYTATKSGDTYTINVKTSNHKNDTGKYNTHIYAYDSEGKYSVVELQTEIPDGNQAPEITDAKITNVSKNGYTVTCKVTDDGSLDRVQMPTWSEKGGQDDLIWYTATKNGDIYTINVKTSNHKNDTGKYNTHIYAYDSEGKYSIVELGTEIPENQAPNITDAKITNVSKNGYTVTCKVTDDGSLDRVQMPTWSENRDQDDLIWYTATKSGDTYTINVKTSDHKNDSGKYFTHIYAYDSEGKYSKVELQTEIPENQAPKITDAKITNVSKNGYTVTCKVTDDGSIDRVQMPTWSENGGQDDLIWYTATKSGDIYTINVKTSNHNNDTGKYNTHIYAYDSEEKYSIVELETEIPENQAPEISDVQVTNITRKGYTVTCKITDDSKVRNVQMPTWSENGDQDDLIWYTPSQKGNTYTLNLDAANHNYDTGKYNTHIYAYDEEGKVSQVELEVELPENEAPVISNIEITNVTNDSYTVTCNVSDDVEVTSVKMPTWTTNNSQDDIIWHEAEIKDGVATFTVNRKDHNFEYGEYVTHIYAYDKDGLNTFQSAGTTILQEPDKETYGKPIIKDVRITDANDDGFTVTCTVSSKYEIDRVMFPTWTYKNDQDDLIWGTGTKNGDQYSFRVERSAHNYEFGTYVTHIYAYDKNGNVNTIELNYHNIVNTTVRQGWAYINGQKYFFDNAGNIAGNMPAKKIIDVSSYNGNIDWDTVKQYGDIDGAILRITAHPGYYIEDTQFARNLAECRRLNIPFGVYIYDYANNTNDAVYEANFVIDILRKYNVSPSELSYPVYYDLERTQISKAQNIANMNAFISTMNANGYTAHVYSYRAMLNDTLNDPSIWANVSWMAAYTNTIGWSNPYYKGNFGWQYTSSGTIPGISGSVDISCWYVI